MIVLVVDSFGSLHFSCRRSDRVAFKQVLTNVAKAKEPSVEGARSERFVPSPGTHRLDLSPSSSIEILALMNASNVSEQGKRTAPTRLVHISN